MLPAASPVGLELPRDLSFSEITASRGIATKFVDRTRAFFRTADHAGEHCRRRRKRRKGRETAREPRQELDSRVEVLSADTVAVATASLRSDRNFVRLIRVAKRRSEGAAAQKSLCVRQRRAIQIGRATRGVPQRPAASANRDENRICRLSRSQSFSIRTTSLTAGPITVKSSRSAAPTLPYSTSPMYRDRALSEFDRAGVALISREQCSYARLVAGEASRCVIHFFEPLLGDLRRPNTREIQARLNDGCDVRTHSAEAGRSRPMHRQDDACSTRRRRLAKQPPTFAEGGKIDAGGGIPPTCSIAGAKSQGGILVAVRNPQWGIGSRIPPSRR